MRSIRLHADHLERRLAPAVVVTVSAGVLTVSSDAGDSIAITAEAGNVKINGVDPDSGASSAASVTRVVANAGPAGGTIDLTAVAPDAFVALAKIEATGGTGADTLRVAGGSLVATTFDGGGGIDAVEIVGGTANTVESAPSAITFNDTSVGITNVERVVDTVIAANRVYDVSGDFELSPGTTNGDGRSRLDSTDIQFELINPTSLLGVTFGDGDDRLTFRGLDNSGSTPATFMFNGGGGQDHFSLTGSTNATPDEIVYDFSPLTGGANYAIGLTGESLGVSYFEGVTDGLAAARRQFLFFDAPSSQGGGQLSPGAATNDGVSRLTDVSDGITNESNFIDFVNPSEALTIDARSGDDLLIFAGLDAKQRPESVEMIGGAGNDTFRLAGTAETVTLDYHTSPLAATIDEATVSFDAEVAASYAVTSNLTFLIRTAATEAISDDPVAHDGVSRLTNPVLGFTTDFLNPSKVLTVSGAAGAETVRFLGTDDANPPRTVALNGGDDNDAFDVVPSLSTAVVIDGGAGDDTLTVILDGAEVTSQAENQIEFANRRSVTFANITEVRTLTRSGPTALTPPLTRSLVGQNDTSFYAAVTGFGTVVYNGPNRVMTTGAFLPAEVPSGVQSILADINGDTVPELISGTGAGRVAEVRVVDMITGARLMTLIPFDGLFTGGVSLSAGDLNADGASDIVVSPNAGGAGRVTVYDGPTGAVLADFFGIDDLNFRGGVRTAVGDINGDRLPDLIVAAGFGGGPRVAIFDGATVVTTAGGAEPPKLVSDFFVFEPELRNGAFISAGDLDGDGAADLFAGGGPNGGPRVLVLDGHAISEGRTVVRANFFAFNPSQRNGVRVAAKDFDGNGRADLVVGGQADINLYNGDALLLSPGGPAVLTTDIPFPTVFPSGVFVG